jgi:hypothetical protein
MAQHTPIPDQGGVRISSGLGRSRLRTRHFLLPLAVAAFVLAPAGVALAHVSPGGSDTPGRPGWQAPASSTDGEHHGSPSTGDHRHGSGSSSSQTDDERDCPSGTLPTGDDDHGLPSGTSPTGDDDHGLPSGTSPTGDDDHGCPSSTSPTGDDERNCPPTTATVTAQPTVPTGTGGCSERSTGGTCKTVTGSPDFTG